MKRERAPEYLDGELYHRITADKINDDGAILLSATIIKAAFEDYKMALRKNLPHMKESCEHFFASENFEKLSFNVTADAIIRQAKKEVEEELKNQPKSEEKPKTKVKKPQKPGGDISKKQKKPSKKPKSTKKETKKS